ncbi:MAG: extracellular solute-binding protein [Alkalispirochaeta sp.]|jgi:iron(III) transport system substrate-binding protein
MRRNSIVLLLLVTAALVFASGSQEGGADSAAQPEERELVVYSTIFAEYAEAMKEGFEALHPGVTVHVLNPGGTEAMFMKLESERANPQADVVHAGSMINYQNAVNMGLLEPYAPQAPGFKSTISVGDSKLELSHPEDYYHVWSLMFTGIMYNQQVLDRYNLPVPRSYQDLANPVYRNQIISADPLKSSTASSNVIAMLQIYGDKAPALWSAINDNLPYYSGSSSRIYTLVSKGEFAMAIGLSRPALVAMGEGFPVNFVFPADGSQIYDNSMAIVAGAKHPQLAREFVDYILSDEMQLKGASYLYIPVKSGVIDPSLPFSLESATANIGTIYSPDPQLAEDNRQLIQDTFGEYIRNKGKQ